MTTPRYASRAGSPDEAGSGGAQPPPGWAAGSQGQGFAPRHAAARTSNPMPSCDRRIALGRRLSREEPCILKLTTPVPLL